MTDTSVISDMTSYDDKKTDFKEATHILMNEKYKRRKTILSEDKIALLSTLDVMAQIYDVPFLKQWIDDYCEYMTSRGGEGRKNIVDIAKASQMREDSKMKDMFNMMGRR